MYLGQRALLRNDHVLRVRYAHAHVEDHVLVLESAQDFHLFQEVLHVKLLVFLLEDLDRHFFLHVRAEVYDAERAFGNGPDSLEVFLVYGEGRDRMAVALFSLSFRATVFVRYARVVSEG